MTYSVVKSRWAKANPGLGTGPVSVERYISPGSSNWSATEFSAVLG